MEVNSKQPQTDRLLVPGVPDEIQGDFDLTENMITLRICHSRLQRRRIVL